jgi:beta-mannanase
MSIEHYGQPPPWAASFDTIAAEDVADRGAIAAIDMSTQDVPLAQIAAGRYDDSIRAWADAARSFGRPFFLLFDEEMNGNWYPYSPGLNGNTAADFVAMWRHVHDVVSSEGASNVTWVWCPNVDPNHVRTPYPALYPGDAYVDWTCLNGYNWGPAGGGWMSFASVFRSSYDALRRLAPSKPIMIGEYASAEAGGSKAAWITDALTTQLPQNFSQIKAVLWLNWRIYEKDKYWPWEIESSTSAQQAFKDGIASSYYAAGGGFDNLTLTKVKPLG